MRRRIWNFRFGFDDVSPVMWSGYFKLALFEIPAPMCYNKYSAYFQNQGKKDRNEVLAFGRPAFWKIHPRRLPAGKRRSAGLGPALSGPGHGPGPGRGGHCRRRLRPRRSLRRRGRPAGPLHHRSGGPGYPRPDGPRKSRLRPAHVVCQPPAGKAAGPHCQRTYQRADPCDPDRPGRPGHLLADALRISGAGGPEAWGRQHPGL